MNNESKRLKYTLNLQMFAEQDPEPTPQDPPADPTPPEPKTVTMTQEELDALIGREKARAKKPFADYDDIKAKLTELQAAEDERKRGELTEIERYKADLEKEQTSKQTLESELSTLRESVKQERIRNAFITAATAANIAYVDDAWSLADRSGVSVGDDGNVVGIDAVIASLIESKPFLVATNTTKPKTIGDPPPTVDEKARTLEAQLEDAKKRKDFSKVVELSNKLKGFIK